MLALLKQALLRYFHENFDDLLKLDMKMARILGAPAPHTLSSYAYVMEQKGRWWGLFWRPIIDFLAKKFFKQENHCYQAYLKTVNPS